MCSPVVQVCAQVSAKAFVANVCGLSGNFFSDLRIWWYAGILIFISTSTLGEGWGGCSCKCPFVKFPWGIPYSQMGLALIDDRWETVGSGFLLIGAIDVDEGLRQTFAKWFGFLHL